MAKISADYGDGSFSDRFTDSTRNPPLGTVLQDVAEDLQTLTGAGGNSVGGDLPAFTNPPTAGEMATLRTRVNEILAYIRAQKAVGDSLLTQKV